MRIALACSLILACGVKPEPAPTPPPEAPFATWTASEDVTYDLTTAAIELAFRTGAPCADAQAQLTVSDGELSRTWTVELVMVADTYIFTLRTGAFEPEPDACVLERNFSVAASVACADGHREEIFGVRQLRFRPQLAFTTFAGLSQHRYYQRANTTPPAFAWTQVGQQAVRVARAAPTSTPTRLANVVPSTSARVVVDGAHHSFISTECNVFCRPINAPGGAPGQVNMQMILAVPHTLQGDHDGRTAVARITVPGRIVDLGFADGVLYALSQVGDSAVISRFTEQPTLQTTDNLLAPSEALPYPTALRLHKDPTGGLVAMVMKSGVAAGEFVFYSPPNGIELPTIGGCGGGTVPVPYPTTGGSSGGGSGGTVGGGGGTSSSSGDEPSTIHGCAKLVTAPGDPPSGVDLSWSGQGVAGTDRLLQIFSAGDVHAVALLDTATDATTWLEFPTPTGPSRVVALTSVSVAPDSSRFLLTTARGFHVFSRDGVWLEGAVALPAACGPVQSGHFLSDGLLVFDTASVALSGR